MKRLVTAALVLAFGSTLALAGPIEDRQAIMKHIAAETKKAVAIVKGQTPFDAAQAKEILTAYIDASQKFPTLFPEDSKTGGDTTAAPAIWEKKAEFDALMQKFGADAQAGLAATDQQSFAAAIKTITGNCGACHEKFRVKKG